MTTGMGADGPSLMGNSGWTHSVCPDGTDCASPAGAAAAGTGGAAGFRQGDRFSDGFWLAFGSGLLFLARNQLDPCRAADGVLGDGFQDIRVFLLT